MFVLLQYDIGFKIRIIILYKLMFWRYMADKKLIDVKPTRKEIFYGFFCTGISLVLLIILGITIVVFANKYMQNMRGNQNYLNNLSITTTDETTDILLSVTGNGNENFQITDKIEPSVNYITDSIPTKIIIKQPKMITTKTIEKKWLMKSSETSTSSPTSSLDSSLSSSTISSPVLSTIPATAAISQPGETAIGYSEIKIEEITGTEAKLYSTTMNESIEKNLSEI